MDNCQQWNCPNMNIRGHCNVTACSRNITYNPITATQTVDSIIFPQTIGSITFYTSKELIDWVCIQQDRNYGIGNGV